LEDPIELIPNALISFLYDSPSNLWYQMAGSGSGGGVWITYALEVVAAAGIIASEDDKFFQYRRISAGTPLSLSTTPFGSAIVWKDGITINVNNLGANAITFPDGGLVQFGLDLRGLNFTLPPGQIASFQYDLIQERWYLIGTSASATSSGGSYMATQAVVAGDKVNLLSIPSQAIKLTAVAPITLNALPFNIPLDLPDGAEIKIIGTGDVNQISLNYEATNSILFGNATLGLNYILSLVYDKTNNYLIETGRNF
ncbi:MAG: hypothetical protein ACHQYQ_11895, partial [Bacteriovoracales bacterium]